ncbi:type VI secretion system tip protein VgrG [Flammeovirgaceae bacterium SG7u.111]|nr:type VI secretion system tip protein VgrG [Flammeovirgaceae bacterium SG7u.132]WPO36482.1 type VI secretion system tip protein VgrG [Flammeovirgaceae bacterium SG7u.111]
MAERTIPGTLGDTLVTFTILSNGTQIPAELEVLSIYVTKEINRVASLKMMIVDGDSATQDFEVSNTDLFIPGSEIEVKAGYGSQEKTIFKGIVVKNNISIKKSGASYLTIECKDKAVKMTVGRKDKLFEEKKDSALIEEIIGGYSLSSDVDATTVTHAEVVQFHVTDWDFVVSRAEVNGLLVSTDDGKMVVKKPDLSGSAVLSVVYGDTILEFEGEVDASSQYAAVKSTSWDYKSQALLEKTGKAPSYDGAGNLTGKKLADVVGLSELELRHSGQVEDSELKAWADAQMLKSRLAKVRGRVKFQGCADVKPGDMIELDGLGDRFNGNVFVSGVRHEVREGNWLTDVQFGLSPKWFIAANPDVNDSPATGLIPAVKGLQIGVVSQLQEDPNGENRILVKLPIVDASSEGIWARLSTLYAGAERGSYFLPEIGDEVIIGFLNDDPRDAIIIGAVHSSANPAPLEATDDNFIKGFVTKSEIKFLFDDEKSIVTLETPGGNKMVVDDDEQAITLEDQHGNKIQMNADGITIDSAKDIVLKAAGKLTQEASQDASIEGMNVSLKASAQFKAEGSAGAEVSSSGQAVLKGAMVMIN